jgi:hypothetical protein
MADPVGNTGYLSDLDIRIWMRDNDPDANLLIDDYEFSPEEIRTATTLAVDYWNEQPPQLRGYDVRGVRVDYIRGWSGAPLKVDSGIT